MGRRVLCFGPNPMKVLITVTRRTTYSSIVEMPKTEFKRLDKALEAGDRDAEEKVNSLIDPNDWQDDSLHHVEDFKPYDSKRD